MFEYHDKIFGPIKVLNVTEARANFAAVLGDHASHYIITKNNKPLRVIIGYEEYERLKKQGAVVGQDLQNRPPFEAAPPSSELEKPKESKSRVPGLLKTQQELAEKVTKPRRSPPTSKTLAEPSSELEPDFEFVDETPSSPAIETLIANEISLRFREIDPVKEPVSESFSSETLADDSSDSELLASEGPQAETIEDVVEESVSDYFSSSDAFDEADPVLAESPPEKVSPVSDEEQSYFDRYKKLYQTESDDEPDFAKPDLVAQSVDEETRPLEDDEAEGFQSEIDQGVVVGSDPKIEVPEVNPEPIPSFSEESSLSLDESQDLPSLKDLLKDIETQPLSESEMQEDPLAESDIDELIERLNTQD